MSDAHMSTNQTSCIVVSFLYHHQTRGIAARAVPMIGRWTIMTCIWAEVSIIDFFKVYYLYFQPQGVLRRGLIILPK